MKYLTLFAEKCVAISLFVFFALTATIHSYGQCSLSCNGTTQVSLSNSCDATITPNMILSDNGASCTGGDLSVLVSDSNGTIPTVDVVSKIYMGQTLTATVVDNVSGNSCWGEILIEDKLGPSITNCPMGAPTIIDCPDISAFPDPIFSDNCDGVLTPVLLSEEIAAPCLAGIIRTVTRTYSAADALGNIASNTCTISLRLRRFNPNRVRYPDSLTVANNTAVSCEAANTYDANGNGRIDNGELTPTDFGVPFYIVIPEPGLRDTVDLYPFPDVYCNTIVTFEDIILPRIGCTQRIMRRWSVNEWHCQGERDTTFTQLIEITDNQGPVLTNCLSTLDLNTNVLIPAPGGNYGDFSCGARVQLPVPDAVDNCSSDISIDVTFPDGHIPNYDGSELSLPMGTNVVLYTVYDECFNSSTCHTAVNIVDNTPPIAICDQNTTVSLTSGGTATVKPESFNDGSYDDCKLHCTLVRRMDPSTCECRTPEICELTFLGNRGGSNYYLSNYRISGTIAENRAASYGGGLVEFESPEEEAYVVAEVRKIWSDRFWTGIKRNGNTFLTADHSPLPYTNWAPDQPSLGLGEDCVMVTPGNVWNDASCASEQRYVLELPEGCGFSNGARFCCEDAGSSHMVVLRVVDFYGNHNDCMVNINVQDKSAPSLTCPPNRTVNCDYIFDSNDLDRAFGAISIGESCGANIRTTVTDDFSECSIGTLTRVWEALAGSEPGAQVVSHCKQIITFTNDDRFNGDDIVCPESEIVLSGCENPSDFPPSVTGVPMFTSGPCDIIGTDYDDQTFTFNNDSGDACFKILRTWEIVDWCRTDFTESFTCHQVIQVSNSARPVISGDKPVNVCSFDSNCDNADVVLEVFGEDDCTTPENLRWTYEIFEGTISSGPTNFSNPIAKESGTGNQIVASGNFPLGSHLVRWTFLDGCGNSTTSDQPFTVANCKAATAYCINGVAVDLMPVDQDDDGSVDFGMIEIWASDFDAGSFHPCGYPVELSFSPDVNDRFRTFDCVTRGTQLVEIWATVTTPTGEQIQTFCSTFIDIQDNMSSCSGQRSVLVQGNVYTETNKSVDKVTVSLEGSSMESETNLDGEYAFPNMGMGGDYIVNPYSNQEVLNGVSTLDLVAIQRHVLGIEQLDSPYKYIAADIDNNKVINGVDLVELRKLILGIYTEFPANDSWRFVDQNYSFTNSTNPLADGFTEDYEISSLDSDMLVDFVAVKIGDVNNSVEVGVEASGKPSGNRIAMTMGSAEQLTEDLVYIPVTIDEAALGMQLELTYDSELFQVVDIEGVNAEVTPSNFIINDNRVLLSWNSSVAVQGTVFNIIGMKKNAGSLDQAIHLVDNRLKSEIYNNKGEIFTPVLNSSEKLVTAFALTQNTPNPFNDITSVNINLVKANSVELKITNIQGMVVSSITREFTAGNHVVSISADELGSAGIYYLTATTSTSSETIKMVLID